MPTMKHVAGQMYLRAVASMKIVAGPLKKKKPKRGFAKKRIEKQLRLMRASGPKMLLPSVWKKKQLRLPNLDPLVLPVRLFAAPLKKSQPGPSPSGHVVAMMVAIAAAVAN
jgi:hypothetical protein